MKRTRSFLSSRLAGWTAAVVLAGLLAGGQVAYACGGGGGGGGGSGLDRAPVRC